MGQGERVDFDVMKVGGKGKKQFEGIAIGLDGMSAYSFDIGQIRIKKLMDTGSHSHMTHSWDLVNSMSPATSVAFLTLRYAPVY